MLLLFFVEFIIGAAAPYATTADFSFRINLQGFGEWFAGDFDASGK